MYITKIGTDYISINEDNIDDERLISIDRVHLIKLDFFNPTELKVNNVLQLYPKTNRYVIEDNIRIYNYILKKTTKKYYIVNKKDVGIISFFKKNNKVLLNFTNISEFEKQFLLTEHCFADILKNLEVIMIDEDIFKEKEDILVEWNGNVIIHDKKYII